MRYYHASQTPRIQTLEPRVSNHGVPLIYFSEKRENVLVYLSNAIEKHCREIGFSYPGPCQKWGPYGFTKDGLLQLEEYYPNALEETYAGVSGYVYTAEDVARADFDLQIPFAAVSDRPTPVTACEFVPDAWEAIREAEREGKIAVMRYPDMPEKMRAWLRSTTVDEYRGAEAHPEYRRFLRDKFPEFLEGVL